MVVVRREVVCSVVGSVVVAVDIVGSVNWLWKKKASGNLMSESQVPSCRKKRVPMLNRSGVVVRPRQPFMDWLRSVEEVQEAGTVRTRGQVFADNLVLASAALDRLLHRSIVLKPRGKSFRLQEKRKAG